MKLFNKVTIIGVGLIGGSLGMAIKKYKLCGKVIGYCRRKSSVAKVKSHKACDIVATDIKYAVSGSELIIIATPVGSIVDVVKNIIKFIKPGCVIMDVGSAKSDITKGIKSVLPEEIFYVGCHPLAGSEEKGVENSNALLFKNSLCVITTPPKDVAPAIMRKILKLWKEIGAKVSFKSPSEHDRVVAQISHLPHLAAMSLVACVDKNSFKFASTGFKDTTRIAFSDPVVWRDILLSNKKYIIQTTKNFLSEFKKLTNLIIEEDSKKLLKEIEKIKDRKKFITR